MASFIRQLRRLALALSVAAAGCSGGTATAPATPVPSIALTAVTLTCGSAVLYGPAALTAGPYGSGSVMPLTAPCPSGSQVSVNFTPVASDSSIGGAPAIVFDLMPAASTSATAVAAGAATGFTAGTAVTRLGFTTPTYASSSYLYVYLGQVQPQGD